MSSQISLLYVDDEPINLTLFTLNFKSKFNVITASDGFEALKKLNQYPQLSVVISDLKMPGMNGIEFIRKAKETYPDLSYYILTGFDLTEEIVNAINEGLFLKCFAKPFNIREIESSIYNAK
ncbi:MAG: response regulator [Bacteroidetes bacterium HGW-Bacteroidetes-15]|nr:MAG: response regulator [Bacteroidetes bacterium HGW-Bacteroidetes-15]